MIKVEKFVVGEIAANCFFVTDDEEKVSLLVDTGDYSYEIEEKVKQFGAERLKYILLTHGHFDHIGNVARLKRKFPDVKVVISKYDAPFTNDDDLNLSYRHSDYPVEHFDADVLVKEGSELEFGKEMIRVMETPGHTRGSVCYILGNNLFSGDMLFRGSIGRIDFPTSDRNDMINSLEKLKALEENYNVYCGHDRNTTLDYEKKNNIYMTRTDFI